MLDRKIQPELKSIDEIQFVKPHIFDVSKKAKLYCLTEVPNKTAKFELYFNAGTIEGNLEIASFVNGLLLSGTKTKTSIEINQEIDDLGGFIEQGVSYENAVITVYALKENILPIARIVKDAIQNCVFDETEFEHYLNERKQKFNVGLEKVGILAQRALRQRLFNSSEKYSATTSLEDFDKITTVQLKEFHHEFYLSGLSSMVLVGAFNQDEIDAFMDVFGSWTTAIEGNSEAGFTNIKGYSHTSKEGAVQTAIRLGRQLFNKTHEDYLEFLILNTIFGDYFGSRLMRNIREDKGYTYGIGSMVGEFKQTGYFIIATEVGKEVKEATLAEIKSEMDRLRTKLVEQDELDLVRNYMLGQILKSADGPYSMMDLFLSVEQMNLDLDFYNRAIHVINTITPERIKALANQYLNWDDFTIVTAG